METIAVLNKKFIQREDALFLKTLSRLLLQWISITIDLCDHESSEPQKQAANKSNTHSKWRALHPSQRFPLCEYAFSKSRSIRGP